MLFYSEGIKGVGESGATVLVGIGLGLAATIKFLSRIISLFETRLFTLSSNFVLPEGWLYKQIDLSTYSDHFPEFIR